MPKSLHNRWAMYDWANSVYNLVITTTFFPIYYTAITKAQPFNGNVEFAGRTFVDTALYLYALSATYLVVAILLPILSSIADYRGNKKSFMRFFCYLGAISCSALYFFTKDNFSLGIVCMMLAAFGFYGSLVFYNSYLPEIATIEERDRVSAKGFTFGYIGSVIMQVIGFLLVFFHDKIPFIQSLAERSGVATEAEAVKITFLLVGLWWFGFAQIPLRALPKGNARSHEHKKENVITGGFRELGKVLKGVKRLPVLYLFLAAFFFYSMGVQTVMLAATNFGAKVFQLPSTNLIVTIVLIQLVAIPGAFLMAALSKRFGNLRVLIGVVLFWILICIAAYFMGSEYHFYALAIAVGLVMGGIQALSRSTYSKLMPPTEDTASYFSFYDVTEKIAIVIGLFSFAFIEELTGNMRNSVLSLISFFSVGLLFLILALSKSKRTTNETIYS